MSSSSSSPAPVRFLSLLVFVTGMLIMIIELVAARIIAPVLGSSLYTWTSVIGVILAGMSLGNVVGGALADRGNPIFWLIRVLLLTGTAVALIPLVYLLIPIFAEMTWPLMMKILLAALFLFSPAAFVGGMILPLAVKAEVQSLSTIGTSAGRLYAMNVAGSIVGTFLAGFFLIGSLGSIETIFLCAVGYAFAALLFPGEAQFKLVMGFAILSLLFVGWQIQQVKTRGLLEARDTDYYFLRVVEHDLRGEAVRSMYLDTDWEGTKFRNRDGVVHPYTQAYTLVKAWKPDAHEIVFLGGGPHVSPMYFHDRLFPQAKIRVLEIDPDVTAAAKEFFDFREDDRMTVVNEDARLTWRSIREPVDIIAVDVFDSLLSPPFHLVTKEYHQEMYDHLSDGGVMVTNLIDGWGSPEQSRLIRSYVKTVQSVFDAVWIIPTKGGDAVQNFVVIATKGEPPTLAQIQERAAKDSAMFGEWAGKIVTEVDAGEDAILLTDNFSPVEQMMAPGLRSFNDWLTAQK